MRETMESVYAAALSSTFKVINPIKKSVIKTDCRVHLFIQENALDILKQYGYNHQYDLFEEFLPQINLGLVWADQDFKSYHHFYNPMVKRGKFGYEDNAMTVTKRYYNRALKYFAMENYERAMFYFGAACHIVQDLTIPQHAKGKLLDSHRQFEVYVKENYTKVKRFKSSDTPLIFDTIDHYVTHNSTNALHIDQLYRTINDDTSRFYLTATKSIGLAQRSTAGCMIMFYKDILYM